MNSILKSGAVDLVARQVVGMAFQRKVFRIEEHARMRARAPDPADTRAVRQNEIAEPQVQRTPIAQRAPLDRAAMERARAQIAEAETCKSELELIYAAVRQTKDEIGVAGLRMPDSERAARARLELQAIVEGAERATQAILQAAEEIEQAAIALSATLKSTHDLGLAQDIQERVAQVFEACNFQDLAGQRAGKVAATLREIEESVVRLLTIWQSVERFKPIGSGEDADGERSYLNGPKLPGDPGHSTQDDINAIFDCA